MNVIIATLIILIVMIVMITLVLKDIIKKINNDAKTFYLNKLQVYDEIIEEKEEELQKLNEELEKPEEELGPIYKTSEDIHNENAFDISIPDYVDDSFYEKYLETKKQFNIDPIEVISKTITENYQIKSKEYFESLKEVEKILNGELLYNMMTLPNQDVSTAKKKLI